MTAKEGLDKLVEAVKRAHTVWHIEAKYPFPTSSFEDCQSPLCLIAKEVRYTEPGEVEER